MSEKVWLITGCSRGLGKALAEAVLAAGDKLVATARNIEQIKYLVEQYGDKVQLVKLDVTNQTDAKFAIKSAFDSFGRLDVLVNNAGYGNICSIEEAKMTDFREEIETNLFGTIIVTKEALPYMRKQKFGHIIQLSSVGGRIGPIGRGPYAVAKWGVEGFSEVLSKEVKPFGIKVTIIEPGGFRTDFASKSSQIKNNLMDYDITVGKTARFQQEYIGKQPGDPIKAAKAILQLTNLDNPPIRLLLGSDAVSAVEKNDLEKIEADKKWRYLSMSTDI
jgi:NAD(P)-dependent dehydrogenase (short-subunit alcohol dehydrogenase family)